MIFVKIGNIFRIRTLPPAAGLGAGTTAGKNHPAAAGDDAAADESDSATAKNDTTAA
nr:hypothetical protein [uncultured Alistipes sp.]